MTPFSRSRISLLLINILWRIQLLTAQNNDQLIMVALKQQLRIPIWSSNDSSYCSWEVVRCNSDFSSVVMLELSNRIIGGNITLISELKALKWLDLANNKLQGPIPSSFGNLVQLEFLDLSLNTFGSSIPPELGKLENIRSLNLSNNYLVSNIPAELKNLEKLQDLQVSGNQLKGSIPSWIGNFTNLRVFAAYENELNGKIPSDLGVKKLFTVTAHITFGNSFSTTVTGCRIWRIFNKKKILHRYLLDPSHLLS